MLLNRRRRKGRPATDLYGRLDIALAVLVFVLIVGSAGYMALGLSFLDAVYQTVITVSTVGFREVGDPTVVNDDDFKVFTILLVVLGSGSVLFFVGVVLETLVEGRLSNEFWRRRMKRDLDATSNHIIVCGWGQVGRSITGSLQFEGAEVVVVDRHDRIEQGGIPLYVHGDATDEANLTQAGVQRARALVTALDSPADNVFVTLSARTMKPDLFIVARANSASDEQKLFRAGADRVVNPHERGGAHMAALVMQPNVAEFLGVVMHDRELSIRIEEIRVREGSRLAGEPLEMCEATGLTMLAIRAGGRFIHHPAPTTIIEPGDVLIALGTEEEHDQLRAVARA